MRGLLCLLQAHVTRLAGRVGSRGVALGMPASAALPIPMFSLFAYPLLTREEFFSAKSFQLLYFLVPVSGRPICR